MLLNMTLNRFFSSTPLKNVVNKVPKTDFNPTKYNGHSHEKLLEMRKNNLHPSLLTHFSKPIAFHQGHKQYLYDLQNNKYLDMFGGICTVSVGHCHPKVTQAVTDQLKTLGHVSNIYLHPKIHEYAERLAQKMPGDLKVIYFVNSGSEANDLATLMVRMYTNRHAIVSLKSGYHGMTYQTMALTSNRVYKYPVAQASGFYTTTNPDPFKGIHGGKYCRDSPIQADRTCDCSQTQCKAGLNYAKDFETVLDTDVGRQNLAGFFAESIQGVNGTVQFPKNYIKTVFDVVKKEGGLFVSDEVQTGFGRTGEHFWGFESHGILPDIVTMAKGIGNGMPLAAVVTTKAVADSLTKAAHFNTFGGNPISCAAGLAVLDIIDEEKLQQNSLKIGTYLLHELNKLKNDFKIIGDVRGKGLMIGVELVQNNSKNDSLKNSPISNEIFLKIWDQLKEKRLIIGRGGIFGNVFRIKPPMCITQEDADFTLDTLYNTLKENNNII